MRKQGQDGNEAHERCWKGNEDTGQKPHSAGSSAPRVASKRQPGTTKWVHGRGKLLFSAIFSQPRSALRESVGSIYLAIAKIHKERAQRRNLRGRRSYDSEEEHDEKEAWENSL